jgi:hypothetical protein
MSRTVGRSHARRARDIARLDDPSAGWRLKNHRPGRGRRELRAVCHRSPDGGRQGTMTMSAGVRPAQLQESMRVAGDCGLVFRRK